MNEYTLYLDESQNKENTYFTISGIIIKSSDIFKLNNAIMNVKKCIWDEVYINTNHPVLHCVELSTINSNRNRHDWIKKYIRNYSHYFDFVNKTKEDIKNIYDSVYIEFSKIFKQIDITVLGCLIDLSKYRYIYGETIQTNHELFFEITMQEIIENYTHFLLQNKGIGNIVYESRNGKNDQTEKSSDFRMFDNFCKIKICNKGITFASHESISKTIRYFHIQSKNDDIAGLQFADFAAYNIVQMKNRKPKQYTEFMKRISEKLYNGAFNKDDRDLRDYFGLKRLPYDFQSIHTLEDENTKIKKSYENLKTDRNNLSKKNNFLGKDKEKLLEENQNLKEKIKLLEQELNGYKKDY